MEPTRDRDLILSPTQFALILDEMTGHVSTYVGPFKQALGQSDKPVVYNAKTGRFDQVSLELSKQEFPAADEGSYMVLHNPASPGVDEHPKTGSASKPPVLQIGRKINVRGPALFPLWPNQTAQVIAGHRLSYNDYLLARVYNADEAKKNLASMVTKLVPLTGTQDPAKDPTEEQAPDTAPKAGKGLSIDVDALTIGMLMIIKGSELSFFIPPTGVELVQDGSNFVRKAVTLEVLEYCILRNENGEKRYVRGPEVVFPEPTETFVMNDKGSPKFRAIELNDDMGIYVKVIADYEDEDGTKHATGEELFITGKEQRIYFPRSEHAVVTYDGQSRIHYGQAIPEGEGRYVLDKRTGRVNMKMGPALFLPDPRHEVIVKRVLDPKTVALLYPGNTEALEHNQRLAKLKDGQTDYIEETAGKRLAPTMESVDQTERSFAGDDFRRKGTRTPPRTVTLDNKYDGVVTVKVWTGYAVLLVDSTGGRRVVVGPQTVHLKYDEVPQVLTLSTGKPKTTDSLFPTAYLRVTNNIVSDIVRITTSDMVDAMVKVVYRVNFEGADQQTWFSVENYVKFLCDHTRSKLRGTGRKVGIQEFMNGHVEIIRDALLGKSAEGEKRSGLAFRENAMRIYDVEIITVDLADPEIAKMLKSTQYNAVASAIKLSDLERQLGATKRQEEITRATKHETTQTAIESIDLDQALTKRKTEATLEGLTEDLQVVLQKAANELQRAEANWKFKVEESKNLTSLNTAELERLKVNQAAELEHAKAELALRIEELKAQAQTVVEKANAISPQFVAALQAFGDKLVTSEAMKNMSPLAILGGTSVADIVNNLFAGTKFHGLLAPAKPNGEGVHETHAES